MKHKSESKKFTIQVGKISEKAMKTMKNLMNLYSEKIPEELLEDLKLPIINKSK